MALTASSLDFSKAPTLSLRFPLNNKAVNSPLKILNDRIIAVKDLIGETAASGFHFIGTLPDQAALDDVDTSSLPENSAYFVGSAIAVWNTEHWVMSPSLQGLPGVGVGEGDDLELVNAYLEAKG